MKHLFTLFISASAMLGCGTKAVSPKCDANANVQMDEVHYLRYYARLQDALDCSRSTGRPVLVAFTGYASEPTPLFWIQLGRKRVQEWINDRLVLCVLIVDDRRPITANDLAGFPQLKGNPTTIGQRNAMLQYEVFSNQSQPLFALVNADMAPLTQPLGYVPDAEGDELADWIGDALEKMP